MTEDKKTVAYKGFDRDFKCHGFQFEVGKSYEHDGGVKICSSGFHACENPFDVWSYYDMSSRYAVVELSGEQKKHGDDSKIAAARIEIKAELTLGEFIPKAVAWIVNLCSNTADERVTSSSGYSAKIGSSGNSAKIGSSGNSAQIGSSGNSAQIGSSGNSAQIGSSGYYAQIVASGENSVIASAGFAATVRGVSGTWVSVAEYDDEGKCVGFATGCIGEDGLMPDTDYLAKGGKLVTDEDRQ